jgi:organic radical activating enzyme
VSKYGSTFCVYPWVHQMVTALGDVRLCCAALGERLKTEDGADLTVANPGLTAAWNGPALREVRRRMLAGETVPSCQECTYLESVGRKSWRQDANEGWFRWRDEDGALTRRIEASRASFEVEAPPQFLDVRLGTKCNLGCRMCNPGASDFLLEEHQQILASGGNEALFRIGSRVLANAGSEWADSPRLWADLDRLAGSVRRVMIAGGEPMLIEQNFRFLELCEEKGRCGEIDLLINTNGTALPERFLRLVSRFHSLTLMVSIDGLGKTQEYIRWPSRWPVIEKHLRSCLDLLRAHRHFRLSLSVVAQLLNLPSLAQYFAYAGGLRDELTAEERARFDCAPILLSTPPFYRVEVAPHRLKQAAARELRALTVAPELEWVRSTIDAILPLCDIPSHPKELIDFCIFNRELDRRRGIHLRDYLPDIYAAVNELVDYDGADA